MPRSSAKLLTRTCLRALVWLVLAVVGLGLSRSLMVCTQPCCAGHVKLVASCDLARAARAPGEAEAGCCGGHARGGGGAPRDGRDRADSGCSGCHHVGLGVEFGMPPAAYEWLAAAPAAAPLAPIPVCWCDAGGRAASYPRATGPPRPDPRTALLATTILRL